MPGDSFTLSLQLGNLLARAEATQIEVLRPARWPDLALALVTPDPKVFEKLLRAPPRGVAVSPTAVRFTEAARIELAARSAPGESLRFTVARDSEIVFGIDRAERPVRVPLARVTQEGSLRVLSFGPGPVAGFGATLLNRTPVPLGLRITAPRQAERDHTFRVHLAQRNSRQQIVGGIAVLVNIR